MSSNWTTRKLKPEDHEKIIKAMPHWWNGRDLVHMVPKLFAVHFQNTSFVVETGEELCAFLVGFMSPTFSDEAYIHFVGVDPKFRKYGIGKELYQCFFALVQSNGRSVVRCCTSPVNKGSIAFHQSLGFQIEHGDGVIDGIPVTLNHNRPGDHKVQFTKHLSRKGGDSIAILRPS